MKLSILFLFLSFLPKFHDVSNKYKKFEELKRFNIEFSFGVGARNKLDTFKNTFTKDLIHGERLAKTKMRLTNDEMQEIYETMAKIDILNYPNEFKPENNSFIIPYTSYVIKVQIDHTEKIIKWDDKNLSEETNVIELRALFQKIQDLIYSKPKYKKMPPSVGGYL